MGKWPFGQDLRKLWENSFWGQDHGRLGENGCVRQDLGKFGNLIFGQGLRKFGGGQDLESCFEMCMHRCVLYS